MYFRCTHLLGRHYLGPHSSTSVVMKDTSQVLPFGLSRNLKPHGAPNPTGCGPPIRHPRGILKPKCKYLRVVNQKSDKFHDISWITVLSIQYTALGEDMMPGLHQTTTLTLVSFVVRNVEPPIVVLAGSAWSKKLLSNIEGVTLGSILHWCIHLPYIES